MGSGIFFGQCAKASGADIGGQTWLFGYATSVSMPTHMLLGDENRLNMIKLEHPS